MPDSPKPIVSALIVSHNTRDLLLQCMHALFASADVPVEAVVVDNDSSDGSAAAVTADYPQATVLIQEQNLGFGRAANVGLERCTGRFILLINPDVTVDLQCIGRLADFMLTRPDAGAVGPRLLMADGTVDPAARRAFPVPSALFYRTIGLSRLFPRSPRFGRYNMGHLDESDVHEIDAGSADCLMLRRAALDRVGFFDPRYFMYGEDIDLCYRLKSGGWKIFYLPTARAVHLKGASTKQETGRMLWEFHRAMWTFHHKHYAADLPAFANGMVWASIWGRWAVLATKSRLSGDPRISR